MKEHFSHGEVVVFQINSLPKGLKKVSAKKGKYIIADSETTGNHHCIEEKENVELYEKDGVFYLKNTVPVDMFCVVKDRHDTEVMEPGIYEIDRAKEYDYLSQQKRNVSD